MTTPTPETPNQPDADARTCRPSVSLEDLAALRQRFVETAARHAGKGDTTNFRWWKKAKDSIRELDAMIAARAASAEKDQPQ